MNKIIEHTLLNNKSRSQAINPFRAIRNLCFSKEFAYGVLVALAAALNETGDLIRLHEQGSLHIH
jgi:hypothetical protein